MITLVAAFMSLAPRPAVSPVLTLSEPVRCLAWTPSHRLLVFTDSRVREWPTGRTAKLSWHHPENDTWFPSASFSLLLNRAGTRAIGERFLIDLRTLRSTPLETPAFWEGRRVVSVRRRRPGECSYVRDRRVTRVAKGWYVLGVSEDGRYGVATRKAPFDNDTTWLLRIDPASGRAAQVFTFPGASNDHVYLASASYNGPLRTWLIHSDDEASGFAQPFLAGPRLRPVTIGMKLGESETSTHLSWVARGSAWTLAQRRFFEERDNGSKGLDAYSFDLWNARTRQTVRLAGLVDNWRSQDSTTFPDRLKAPVLAAPALDWARRRFAYSQQTDSLARVYVRSVPRL